jgi:hypothetical protein
MGKDPLTVAHLSPQYTSRVGVGKSTLLVFKSPVDAMHSFLILEIFDFI